MSRVARHRAINDLLKPEFDAGLHALAVEPAVPGNNALVTPVLTLSSCLTEPTSFDTRRI